MHTCPSLASCHRASLQPSQSHSIAENSTARRAMGRQCSRRLFPNDEHVPYVDEVQDVQHSISPMLGRQRQQKFEAVEAVEAVEADLAV